MSRTPWIKESKETIKTDIADVLRDTAKSLDSILESMTKFDMPEAYISWASSHTDALNAIAGLISATVASMPDQTSCFNRGVPCLIERTKTTNASKRRKKAGSAIPVCKKPAKKKTR